MRVWFAPAIAILVTAMPAMARDITVRSGEHTGFSRLVFYIKPTDAYAITNVVDGYRLTLPQDVTSFNSAQVFELIPRTRVEDLIYSGNGEIIIREACDCHIKELRLASGEVVIDIVDGPDPNTHSEPTTKMPDDTPAFQISGTKGLLPLFGSGEYEASLEKTVNAEHLILQADPPPAEEEQSLVDKQRLLTQLSKAAAEGLIEAKIDQPKMPTILADSVLESEELMPEPFAHTPNDHVRMQTAHDEARAMRTGQSFAARACLPDDQFDIASWGHVAPASTQPTAEYSSSYLGEFDRPDEGLLLAHIRQNIFMTFGLEALQLIDIYDGVLSDITSLRMMAEVMEYGHSADADRWLTQISCNNRIAMWAVLAQRALPAEVNETAILRSFSELPSHLRSHLAPVLARKFLDAGETDVAIEIRNIAARSGREPSESEAHLEAEIKLSTGQANEAESELYNAVQNDLSRTQSVVTALMESKLENDRGISDQELSLLASIAFEHGESPMGIGLQLLHARSLFHMGRFAQGFSYFDDISGFVKQTQLNATLDEAGQKLLSLGSDSDFLTFSMTRNDWGTVSAETRLEIAKRLKKLGFTENARRFVLNSPNAPDRATREFLGSVAMRQRKPGVALSYLVGLETEAAVALRQQALKLRPKDDRGQVISKNLALASVQKSDTKTTIQILDIPAGFIPDDVIEALREEHPTSEPDAQTDLQSYQAILDRSISTRDALNSLLGLFPTVDDGK